MLCRARTLEGSLAKRFRRNAIDSATAGPVLCIPESAGGGVFDPSAADHLSAIRLDSFHTWVAGSGVDFSEGHREASAMGSACFVLHNRDMHLRFGHCTRRRGGRYSSTIS